MTNDAAERWLLDRELFGMRFGLDRMRRLLTALGSPQERFRKIHVVGTNGKSSTTRFAAALLGPRSGAFLSPHLESFRERVRIGDEDVSPEDFSAAIARVARAAEMVDRTLEGDDRVTQFEALTAAAYYELARQGVEVAVVEAGLGGRWDATNVIDAEVVVLTNVGLEHTRWLGPTVRDIAKEKLAVVGPSATLVVPSDLHPDAREEAERVAAGRIVVAPDDAGFQLGAGGGFQQGNFALARAAAEALRGERLREEEALAAAALVRVPGRFQVVGERPLTILDGAHNPSGMQALARSAAALRTHSLTDVVVVLSVLDDKDVSEMLRAILPHATEVVATSNANPRALSPATIASLTEQLGGPPTTIEPDPHKALDRARTIAGPDGAVLATGSIYLVADLLRPVGQSGRRSRL